MLSEENTKLKILVLSSNPSEDLKYLDIEIDDLVEMLTNSKKFALAMGLNATAKKFSDRIIEHNPAIVHFCGHGEGGNGLVLQDEKGEAKLFTTESLVNLFKIVSKEVNCFVINACQSDIQAEAISQHINYVVGMRGGIDDQAAFCFSTGFFGALGFGSSIEKAFEYGCQCMRQEYKIDLTKSTQNRKLINAGDEVELQAEYLQPVLMKKSGNISIPVSTSLTLLSEVPQDLVDFVDKEIDLKRYKDNARKVYDNFGQVSKNRDLTEEDVKEFKALLEKVETIWIKNFLNNISDEGFVIHSPNLENRTGTVSLTKSYEEIKGTKINEEISHDSRTLLILGSPGSGKTIALLQLTERLVKCSNKDISLSVPVVFNLSSWTKEYESIFKWLIDELRVTYQVPEPMSRNWIHNQNLILILDGLDEVKKEYRGYCIELLNQFIASYPQTEIAVCSRLQDYLDLDVTLKVNSAICLQPLSSEQVYQTINEFGGNNDGLINLLNTDVELEQFAKTPLILNFMCVAYQGLSFEELSQKLRSTSTTEVGRKQHLFKTYIDVRLSRDADFLGYTDDQIKDWLCWLAKQMSKSVFNIEEIQPQWLPLEKHRFRYRIAIDIIIGFLIGIIAGIYSVYFCTLYNESKVLIEINEIIKLIGIGIMSGLITGLISGLITWQFDLLSNEKMRLPGGLNNYPMRWLIFFIIFAISLSSSFFLWPPPLITENTIDQASPSLLHSLLTILAEKQTLLTILTATLGGFCFSLIHKEIIPVWRLVFVFFSHKMLKCVIISLIFSVIPLLFNHLDKTSIFTNDHDYYLITVCILIGVAIGGFQSKKSIDTYIEKPNEGIFRSLTYTLRAFCYIFIATMFICWWGDFAFKQFNPVLICIGLAIGLLSGLGLFAASGLVCIQHFTLRLMLYIEGHIPLDYVTFLKSASECHLMKKIGGGYIFFHRMLKEHFALMKSK